MSDIIDEAQTRSEQFLKVRLEAARKQTSIKLNPTGFCLFCEEPLPDAQRFCDKDCAEDAEKRGTYDGRTLPTSGTN